MKIWQNRLFCCAWLSFLLCTVAVAQDPLKVEPTHYKLAFENEYVQVVNVHYGPHEKSALHAHMGGVVVVLTAGHLRFTDENGKVQEVHAKPGDPRWFPPFKHTVENLGDSAYNAVYIGIKDKRLSTELNVRGASSPPDGLKLDGSKLDGSKLDEQTKKIVAEALLAGAK